LYKRLL